MLKVELPTSCCACSRSGAVMRICRSRTPFGPSGKSATTQPVPDRHSLNNGREVTALQMQAEYFEKVAQYVDRRA